MIKKRESSKESGTPLREDPFANGVLAAQSRNGELPDYSYTPNGLPKLRAKSVPGWSPFFEKQGKSRKNDGEI